MEKPILFNTEMVQAILAGRKTQTRRIVKPNARKFREAGYIVIDKTNDTSLPRYSSFQISDGLDERCIMIEKPFNVGDVLWVRETWCKGRIEYGEEPDGRDVPYIEQCTGDDNFIPKEWAIRNDVGTEDVVWRPAIHMPREAARLFLKVTNVRAECLQQITDEEAIAEGANCKGGKNVGIEEKMRRGPIDRFAEIWNSTIKPVDFDRFGWAANPWVWVIEFELMERSKLC